nr:hypothetical protein GCM10025732_57630 [Glycomyces mayteni]
MVVDPFAGARAALVHEHALNPVEQLLGDKRFVPPVVFLALEHDTAQIPAIAEQPPDGLDRDRPTAGHILPRTSAKPRLRDRSLQVLESVPARRVELEHHGDERCPLGVYRDGPDFAAVDLLPHVQVPERREARDTAAGCLRGQLVGHIGPGRARLVLVHTVEDRGHQITDVAVLGVIHDRDELHPELPELPTRNRRIGRIAMHARARVHDDGVHVLGVADPRHHLLELRPAINSHPRFAGLKVLVEDLEPEILGLLEARLALRGNGIPFGVVVGVDLTPGRHPQVQHRSLLL